MAKLGVILIVFVSVISASAQQSEVRNVGTFSGVRASEGIDVYLQKGGKESVKVVTSGSSLSDVVTEVSGSTLKIHMRESNFRRNTNVKVYVTYTNLSRVSASSAANIFSENTVAAENMNIDVSSAATVELTIDAGDLEVSVSSAGDVQLKGRARSAQIEVSSAGQVGAYDLQADIVEAEASSAGAIKIQVGKELQAEASSGGSIRYRGNPSKSKTDSSSGGSVKKSD